MPETYNAEWVNTSAARTGKYAFFRFRTGRHLASACGCCSGQVDRQTGEILATISYGLFQYREVLKLNTSDPVNTFPYTIEDEIICAARRALKSGRNFGLVGNLLKEEKLPSCDSVLFVSEQLVENGNQFSEQEVTKS